MKIVLETLEPLFTIFFVAVATLELSGILADKGQSTVLVLLAGIVLMGLIFLRIVLRAWSEWADLFRAESTFE